MHKVGSQEKKWSTCIQLRLLVLNTKMRRCCVCFGSSSGAHRKANFSIGSVDISFVRCIRIKTSEEQGMSLFSDEDLATCPRIAIGLALVTHSTPTISALSQLSEQTSISQSKLAPAILLIDVLNHPGCGVFNGYIVHRC